jgi:hypothetical protein
MSHFRLMPGKYTSIALKISGQTTIAWVIRFLLKELFLKSHMRASYVIQSLTGKDTCSLLTQTFVKDSIQWLGNGKMQIDKFAAFTGNARLACFNIRRIKSGFKCDVVTLYACDKVLFISSDRLAVSICRSLLSALLAVTARPVWRNECHQSIDCMFDVCNVRLGLTELSLLPIEEQRRIIITR